VNDIEETKQEVVPQPPSLTKEAPITDTPMESIEELFEPRQ